MTTWLNAKRVNRRVKKRSRSQLNKRKRIKPATNPNRA